jgi:hypothetical protein
MYDNANWGSGASILSAIKSGNPVIRRKILQPGAVLSSTPLPTSPVGADLFAATKYEVAYEVIDKLNDLTGILQAPPQKKDGTPSAPRHFPERFKQWIKSTVDAVSGGDGVINKVFDTIGSVAAGDRKTAIGFFPNGMPLDGSDPGNWEWETRRQILEMLRNDGMKAVEKGQTGNYVCPKKFSNNEALALLAIAVIANDPISFRDMILEQLPDGTWRLKVFANAGDTEDGRLKNATDRLEQLGARLAGLAADQS